MNQYHLAQQRAKQEAPKKALEELFDKPPKPQGVSMASKLDELQQKIESLQQERDDLLAKEKSAAIADINAKIREFGIKAKQLNFDSSSKSATAIKSKVAVKYRLGTNSWTGRGRKPKWLEDHLAKGAKLEEILVK